MKKFFILVLAIAIAFPIFSANFRKGDFVKVEKMEGDLYSSANELQIGSLNGDLFAVSRRATLNEKITGGITFAGERFTVEGTVGKSIRFFGRLLEINGKVKGDILFLGQELIISKGAKILGQIYAGGSDIVIDGEVEGPVYVGCNEFTLHGTINTNAKIKAQRMRILEGGKIAGNLDYWGKKPISFPEGTIGGKSTFHPFKALKAAKEKKAKKYRFSFFSSWFKVAWFISSLFIGFIILLLFPAQVKKLNEVIINRPFRSFLFGAAGVLIIILLIIIFFVLLFTIPMNFVITPLFLIFLYFGKLLAGFAIGYIILKGIFKKEVSVWLTYPVGLVALVILSFIPYIGWLLMLIARLWGFGGFFYKLKV